MPVDAAGRTRSRSTEYSTKPLKRRQIEPPPVISLAVDLAADPDNPERRILASTKDYLGRPPTSLAFRLSCYR
jgi:hypothetical protein